MVLSEFESYITPAKQALWVDDPNVTTRFVIRRAKNRFQAYQRLEGAYYSVGYLQCLSDAQAFLRGHQVDLIAEFGENTATERLHYTSIPITND